ncbi:MAG: hypothetical protein P8I51_07905 [Polaribacter sp.]|jgi:hypothetical protein|nr:hypothetical protein [Polaribacter sp.]MDG1954800.1 hypothetical protein [Polaribacter sp.]MDG2073203.1 hypothetical protein [Polaribacter sp.]
MPLKTKLSLRLVSILLLISAHFTYGQDKSNKNNSARKSTGVSVAPAHFHFNQKPGEVRTYDITVNNNTSFQNQFNVNMYDFNMNGKGKSSFLPAGDGKYSLSKWLNVSPSFIELKPFETKLIKVTVSVPNDTDGDKAAWSILMVEQVAPRKSLDNVNGNDNTIALGVVPTYAFGIFAYQNPPNVTDNRIEFTDFQLKSGKAAKFLHLEVQNTGDGIAYCTSYIDLTNLDTGVQQRLKVIFTDFTKKKN